jgi:taurine dioxygenase
MSVTRFAIRPLRVGAEIVDLPAGTEVDDEVKAELYEAWLQYGFLLFRDVKTSDDHLAISRSFGELELHPMVEMRAKEDPLFMSVGGEHERPWVYDETEMKVNTVPWHRDTAYTPNICKGAMLRLVETPAELGDTWFADTALAYDELPEDARERLESLEWKATWRWTPMQQTQPGAIWTSVRYPTSEEYQKAGLDNPGQKLDTSERFPPVVHPALIVHPESGRKCIFLSPKEFECFLGMDRSQSDQLFEELVAHLLQDRYVYKHHWLRNDAIVWDNRRVMHAAVGNKVGDRRRGLRTTLAGEFRIGRLYADAAQTN